MGRGTRFKFRRGVAALSLLLSLFLAAGAEAAEQKLTASDGAANDQLGFDVAIDGDTLVVGAENADGGRGAIYVYERSGDTWSETAKLTASDRAVDDELGSSVAIEGDTIVAGAPFDDTPLDTDAGSVYTFARTGAAARTETAKLTLADGVMDEGLGNVVAIDGDTIVAGAPGDFVGANTNQGAAYTFARAGAAARNETGRLVASDGASGDRLGWSVAVDGDTIVAGSPFAGEGASNDEGSVYTFARTGAAVRTQTAELTAAGIGVEDELGYSVAIDGDTIVAGIGGDGPGPDFARGGLYTFARSGSDRTQTARLAASDGTAGDLLGESVAIDGNTIVAGARFAAIGASGDTGAIYTFARTGAAVRTEAAKLGSSDGTAGEQFGFSVAIDGAAILAGARRDTIGSNDSQGSATIFSAAAIDSTAPKTKGLREKSRHHGKVLKFRFKSSEPDSTFRCKLDKKKFKRCHSPRKVKTAKLKPGKHRFSVFAVDAAGNADRTPAKLKFKIDR